MIGGMTGGVMKKNNAMGKTRAAVTRVMVFGTFDVMHKGHEHMFQQARALAQMMGCEPYLIVSVARDSNVARIKGSAPLLSERKRLKLVASSPLVDKAVLGAVGDHIPHIVRERPDIIALGYDQTNYVRGLKSALVHRGLKVRIVRLKSHYPKKYKSSVIKAQL